jgi:3-oxoacyl-[acyl-carrier-protein] synthase II
MERAMQSAAVGADDIGYVNAHGTGTPLNDAAEVKAYEKVFASRIRPLFVSSTKFYIGYTLGAVGVVEAVITLLTLRTNLFPRCGWSIPSRRSTSTSEVQPSPVTDGAAMSVSAGFGSNASLVFRAPHARG